MVDRFGVPVAADVPCWWVNRMEGFKQRKKHIDDMYVTRRAVQPTSKASCITPGARAQTRCLSGET